MSIQTNVNLNDLKAGTGKETLLRLVMPSTPSAGVSSIYIHAINVLCIRNHITDKSSRIRWICNNELHGVLSMGWPKLLVNIM